MGGTHGGCPMSPEKAFPLPISSPILHPQGAGVLHLLELLFPPLSPSTKQLELWFSSLQEDAGQRLRWERMGVLGWGRWGKGSLLLVPRGARSYYSPA